MDLPTSSCAFAVGVPHEEASDTDDDSLRMFALQRVRSSNRGFRMMIVSEEPAFAKQRCPAGMLSLKVRSRFDNQQTERIHASRALVANFAELQMKITVRLHVDVAELADDLHALAFEGRESAYVFPTHGSALGLLIRRTSVGHDGSIKISAMLRGE